jgi:hypothetical protein
MPLKPVSILLFPLLFAACATSGQVGLLDFNSRFNEAVPTSPQYKIEGAGINRYQIVLYQGSALISERTTRASFLTRAGLIAMEAHCIEKGGVLGEHTFQDRVDSLGYINVIGFFSCRLLSNPAEPPKSKPEQHIEI